MSETHAALPATQADIVQQALERLIAGDYTARAMVVPGEQPHQLVQSINQLAEQLEVQQAAAAVIEQRGEALLDVMMQLATRNYRVRAEVSDDDTIFDALATGLNMLTDELEANEVEQERLNEEIIRSQAAVIQELSTPLIPINNDILVMPIVGHVDTARANQIINRLLEGVAETKSRTVIMDITGVSVIDTQTANALLRAAKAAQLLGTQVILTGIRPEVAQSIVSLGVDLQGLTTWGTLQMGMHYAFRQYEQEERAAPMRGLRR